MSKSLGNTIAPSDVEKQFGAEILRLWVTSVDSSNDAVSYTHLDVCFFLELAIW